MSYLPFFVHKKGDIKKILTIHSVIISYIWTGYFDKIHSFKGVKSILNLRVYPDFKQYQIQVS
jgi:hypothetical protein